MAVTATKALGRVLKAIATDQPVYVSDEEFQRRLDICRKCPRVRTHEGNDFILCTHPQCGCGLNGKIRHKARLTTEKCDDGQWVLPSVPVAETI